MNALADLDGKVALVTGAARGIGFAIAEYLAKCSMAVAINDVSDEAACAAAARIPGALGIGCNITRKADVEAMIARVEEQLGPLWLLVNNAGVYHFSPTPDLSEEDWDADIGVDLKGTFLCSQAAIRRMIPRRAGRIVNVSSIAGFIVRTNQLGYSSAKAAVIHLTRCLAVEVAPHGITVNCLCPGMTESEMLLQTARARGLTFDDYATLVPAGRLAVPEDHASLVAYFATELSRHITGQVVAVDGGQSLNLPLLKTS